MFKPVMINYKNDFCLDAFLCTVTISKQGQGVRKYHVYKTDNQKFKVYLNSEKYKIVETWKEVMSNLERTNSIQDCTNYDISDSLIEQRYKRG